MKKTFVFVGLCIIGLYILQTQVRYDRVPAETQKPSAATSTIQKKTISLNFVGDILAARAVELTMRKKGYDYPFEKIVDKLADADITLSLIHI